MPGVTKEGFLEVLRYLKNLKNLQKAFLCNPWSICFSEGSTETSSVLDVFLMFLSLLVPATALILVSYLVKCS